MSATSYRLLAGHPIGRTFHPAGTTVFMFVAEPDGDPAPSRADGIAVTVDPKGRFPFGLVPPGDLEPLDADPPSLRELAAMPPRAGRPAAFRVVGSYWPGSPVYEGSIVHELMVSDFGLAAEATARTGVEIVSVTMDPSGGYPSFTMPAASLERIE